MSRPTVIPWRQILRAYVANRLNGKGNVVMFVFDAFPPVQAARRHCRCHSSSNNPDIKVLERVTPDVAGWRHCRFSRAKMEAILAAHPEKGAISGRLGGMGPAGLSARCRPSRPPAAAE